MPFYKYYVHICYHYHALKIYIFATIRPIISLQKYNNNIYKVLLDLHVVCGQFLVLLYIYNKGRSLRTHKERTSYNNINTD